MVHPKMGQTISTQSVKSGELEMQEQSLVSTALTAVTVYLQSSK